MLPYNLISYGLLQHLIAQECGFIVGSLVGVFGDTHIYEPHIEQLKKQIEIPIANEIPKLEILETSLFDFDYTKVKLKNYNSSKEKNLIKYQLFN